MSSESERQGQAPPSVGQIETDRRTKLARLRDEFGIDPHGHRVDGLVSLAEARGVYDAAADDAAKADPANDSRTTVKIAGRVMLHRDIGSLVFMTLRDQSGDLQVAISKKSVDEKTFKLAKLTDLGDIVVVTGKLGTTKTGEITVWASSPSPSGRGQGEGASEHGVPQSGAALTPTLSQEEREPEPQASFAIACKSLAPPPEKWHGLSDPELRYRRRYTDLWANPEVLATFEKRSLIVKAVRDFLTTPPADLGPGFLEVETPMMQPIAGGAAARPFVTHHNALDMDLFLRIAPELYLKRLLVGGMPRVFEINRNFRNEGIDRSHNPEFTMLELYQAFGDLYSVMHITERLIHHCATLLSPSPSGRGQGEGFSEHGTTPAETALTPTLSSATADLRHGERGLELPFGEHAISYALPFRRAKYMDLFREYNGFDPSDQEKLAAKARQLHVEAEGKHHDVLLNEVWEKTVEHHLIQPTFVMDYPASLCPLTKRKANEPEIAERFELFVAGMELANAYTELNDPDVQRANFESQIGGEDEEAATFRTMDEDFIEALKVGMPPAGGLGVGIDRLVMLLTNNRSIRDVILFPLMRPTQ